MAVVIRIRRATTLEWSTSTRILQVGELALDTTLNKIKVGNGQYTFSQLPFLNVLPSELSELVQDNIASFITGGAGIDTAYVDNGDGSGTLTISVENTIADKQYVDDAVNSLGNTVDTTYLPVSDRGNPDGVASLGPDGLIPDSEISTSIARVADITTHNNDTTSVHGIADTSVLLTTAGGTLTGNLFLHADPANALEAATKQYVDAVSEGLHVHESVVAATTINVNLSADVQNGSVLDGVTLATNDRILIKDQTDKTQNGIYKVAASGAPSRAIDFDSPAEIDGGDFVFVLGGTYNDNTGWVQTNIVGTIGSSPIEFTQFSGKGTYTAGLGLSLNGTQFSVDNTIARVDSPTFTGTVSGITKSMVGLGDVDNTSDLNKPISTATQTELDKKTDELYTYISNSSTGITISSATHKYNMLHTTSSSAVIITLPNATTDSGWEVGSSAEIRQMGDGQITVQAEAPATVVSSDDQFKSRVKYSSMVVEKIGANSWILTGDTTP